jgi:CRP/FNR family transcriptional regulator
MSPQEAADFLKVGPVFAALPSDELNLLAATARATTYRVREPIFMEGDPARWFCIVKSGRVKILRQSRSGKDVVLELLGPGEPFGGVAVLERRPYPATAEAMEPSVVVKLPAESVVSVAERYPSVVRELALLIGRRLRSAHDSVKSLAVDPVEARLAATLLRLGAHEGRQGREGLVLPFHPTRQNLADMAGTTVETTIRIVSRWLKEGVVQDDGTRLVLKNVPVLRRLAEGPQD